MARWLLYRSVMLPRLATFAIALVGVTSFSSSALACFDGRCGASVSIPAEVPANVPGFFIDTRVGADGTRFLLKRVDDGLESEVLLELAEGALVMGEALVPGGSYVLYENASCDGEESLFEHTFIATEEVELPAFDGWVDIGEMEARPVSLPDGDGVCLLQEALTWEERAVLEPEMRPWMELAVWEVVVDGEVWQPTFAPDVAIDPRGVVTTRVHAECPEYSGYPGGDGMGEGSHLVGLRARLPGSDVAVDFHSDFPIEVRCPVPMCPGFAVFDVETGTCGEPIPDTYPVDECDPYGPGRGCYADHVDAESGGGCSATGVPTEPSAALFALVGLWWVRRRRAR